jgi:Virulence factor
MSPRRGTGPRCTVIWWHDIPTQVVVRDGDRTLKAQLPARFQHAVDRAAMGGGRAGSGSYMDGWTRSERPCSGDLQAELDAEVADLDDRFPPAELDRIIAAVRAARKPTHEESRTS